MLEGLLFCGLAGSLAGADDGASLAQRAPVLAAPGLPGFGHLGGAVANSRGEQAPGLFTSVPLKHALPCLPAQAPKSGGPNALGWRHRRRFKVCGLAGLGMARLRVGL